MTKKLAKIKYLPNNFQIIEAGDYVECAVSGKKINIENLTYWNVELQEPYFSYLRYTFYIYDNWSYRKRWKRTCNLFKDFTIKKS